MASRIVGVISNADIARAIGPARLATLSRNLRAMPIRIETRRGFSSVTKRECPCDEIKKRVENIEKQSGETTDKLQTMVNTISFCLATSSLVGFVFVLTHP